LIFYFYIYFYLFISTFVVFVVFVFLFIIMLEGTNKIPKTIIFIYNGNIFFFSPFPPLSYMSPTK